MSRRVGALPLRFASAARQNPQPWMCRRCLATQAEAPSTSLPTPLTTNAPTPPSTFPRRPHASEAEYDPSLPSSQRTFQLNKSDRYLKRGLPQRIPQQYLVHTTSDLIPEHEKQQREKTLKHKRIVGVVVSAGKMHKTVKVRVPGQRWEKKIGKYFADNKNYLVHDPNSSLLAGDVVELHRLTVSTAVKHVVASIVAPFGKPVEERPPIPTPDERLAAYKGKRFAKLKRRELRRLAAKGNADAIKTLQSMGLDPGHGVELGDDQTTDVEQSAGKTRGRGKRAVLGKKGQKLLKGVLPGGKHEVGKIDERAKHNKAQAMKLNRQAEENLLEAKKKGEELQSEKVSANPASSTALP